MHNGNKHLIKSRTNNKTYQYPPIKHNLPIAAPPKQPNLIFINGRNINTIGRIIYLTLSAKKTIGKIYKGISIRTNLLKNKLSIDVTRPKNKDTNILKTTTTKKTIKQKRTVTIKHTIKQKQPQ